MIYLDLGDGVNALAPEEISEETQNYIDSIKDRVLELWAPGNTDADCAPLPAGVVAWVTYDDSPSNPRVEDYQLTKLYAPDTITSEDANFAGFVDRFADRRDPQKCVERAAAQNLGAVAVDRWNIGRDQSPVWGYITHDAVMQTVSAPVTPEQVAEFLDLDLRKRGLEILAAEVKEYEAWAAGEVYVVNVRHVPSGNDTCLAGVYDFDSFTYARQVAGELAKEVLS